ncbi:MAG: glycosyltransferase family 4 protein [Caldimonas sp.]
MKPATVALIGNQAWAVLKFRSRLIETLRADGYRVVVLAHRDATFERLRPLCDELIDVKMVLRQISPLGDLRTLAAYWRHLRRLDPFAVLSFSIKPNIYGSLVCRWLRLPVVNNVTGLGAIELRSGRVASTVRWLYRRSFSHSHRVFFQNPQDMQAMLAQAIVGPDQARLLPGSGVDTARFTPAVRAPGDRIRFCMIARLLRDKGVVEFAEAAGKLRSRHPDLQFDLWGILDAADPRCVTRAEVAAWEERGWLGFHGEARDAAQAFEFADVVVLPSFYPEGTPRTLLEAGSMALPCITTDMPGCRDAVVHEVTGFLCPPRDAGALAEAMMRAVEIGPEGRRAMGERARARILTEFDEDIVLAAYRDQLSEIAAEVGLSP